MESVQISEPDAPPEAGSISMIMRTTIGAALVVIVGLLLALDAEWEQGFVYAGVGMALVAVAMDEFARLVRRLGADVSRSLLVLGGSALFLVQWAGWASPATPDPWLLGSALLCLVVMALFSERVVRGRTGGALHTVSLTAAGLVYVPLLLGFLTAVRVQFGVAGLVTTLVVCKGGSTGAYFVGKSLGRTKLAPGISPKKTVAGAVGAVLVSAVLAYALSRSPWAVMGGAAALLYGLVIAVAATFGDLAASLLKREAGVKDSGDLVPGNGGMLDMVDDVLFAAPVSYLFLLGTGLLGSGG